MENFRYNFILCIEKKVRGLTRITRCSPYHMARDSGVKGGFDVDYSPEEFEIVRVNSVDLLVCQCKHI